MHLNKMLRHVAVLLTLVLTLQAKDLTSWDTVTGLTKGQEVEVTRKSGGIVKGEVTSTTPDGLTLQTKKGEVSLPKPEIATVGIKTHGSKTGKIVGTAIGAVAGLAGGAALGTRLANEGQGDKAAITAVGAAIGAAIGLGIGWDIHGGYKTIYKGQ